MAARFLPEVDRVTAAVAGSSLQSTDAAAVAAMVSLLLASQVPPSSFANGACVLDPLLNVTRINDMKYGLLLSNNLGTPYEEVFGYPCPVRMRGAGA